MYFVNKEQLSTKLNYLYQLTEDYSSQRDNKYAFERIAHMLIEISVDIGNMIIDGFILRDPGNYKDVIDILELEGVISKETQQAINRTVEVRKQFVHDIVALNVDELKPLFDEALPKYRQFIDEVMNFLKNENVPVTAFGKGEA
ncbi:DUF86 domain-containing protein [Staphylococcus massiliensis]|uniref:DUF86 domain-containing protein n=1 Tax=Staphylococcus massiliensis S46 TaxID=1229783 RepID=K9APS5_9STAP|nr:DUF86 domain-containing protein [Staphylococcus massiliensis]EKU48021.1 hypothetical protein C273_06163 [Staphylococcus massiliensis S46]MCG3400040.1 DUF86 domain-containing protein [Staphylococcus massiliensis]MCG3401668.1 DUF86 domain-containing protein [Staphylococcus massiliensis]MCG3412202.1 DUF86 domain-containing protein [Staphylococcus massiliensis]POA00089.1 DUF86 domain-containing protein [Staphylococcus massiliensis CCUG 55927]